MYFITIYKIIYFFRIFIFYCLLILLLSFFLQKLKFQEEPKIKTFHIVNYKTHKGNELRQVLVTYISKCNTKIYIVLFDLDNGVCTKSTCIS